MANDYRVVRSSIGASVTISSSDEMLDAFIDIYADDERTPSPFRNVKDAELFAMIIVKLLRCVDNDIE